nr:Chloramphenicol phosphotransferase-like protein [uncultured bacterium]
MAKVIVLNGVGSVGKSSTAKALQALAKAPLLHVSMDAFLEMLPAAMFGDADGLLFEPLVEDGKPSIAIRTGPVVARTLAGMRHAVAAMAGQGNDLIVDEVLIGEGEAAEYRTLLSGHDLRFVGLFAPLEVLEAREKARGDREIGLARWQFQRVHAGVDYDLTIDTLESSPEQSARRIAEAFGL